MAVIDYSNLLTETRTNILAILKDRTYVRDPLHKLGVGSRKMIYGRFPNILGNSFKGYPFIVLDDVELFEPFSKSSDGGHEWLRLIIDLSVYCSDAICSKMEGTSLNERGQELVMQISNDIVKAFKGKAVRDILRGYGMKNVSVVSVPSSPVEEQEETVFVNRLSIGFELRNIGVTA